MNIEATIEYGAPTPGFPAGSVIAGILVTLAGTLGSSQNQTLAPTATGCAFTVSVADTYTATAVAVSAAGDTFGIAVSSTPLVVTGAATISLTLPSAISLAQTS